MLSNMPNMLGNWTQESRMLTDLVTEGTLKGLTRKNSN